MHKYKVGDKVKMNVSRYYRRQDQEAEVIKEVILAGNPAYEVKFSDGVTDVFMEDQLDPVGSTTYKVGDVVTVRPDIGTTWAVNIYVTQSMKALAGQPVTVQAIQTSFHFASELYLIKEDQGNTLWDVSCFTGLAPTATSGTYRYSGYVGSTVTPEDPKCWSHNWKKYFGLNDKYQYCDNKGCTEKRDYDA